MATRSLIGLLLDDGRVKYISCHYDGYPEGVGSTLVFDYKIENKIKELLSHGDLSVLETNIHPADEHDFDNPEKGVCVVYGRDRGEEGIDAQVTSIDEFHTNSNSSFTEFLYLFTGGNWWVYDNLEKNGWELVKKLLPDFDLTPEDLSCSISL
jgi:hypothetical protein